MKYLKWLDVRINILGKWSKKPDWCCLQINKYLGNFRKCTIDKLMLVEYYLDKKLIGNEVKCIENLKTKVKNEIRRRNKNDTRRKEN